jgi:hypothetical protein
VWGFPPLRGFTPVGTNLLEDVLDVAVADVLPCICAPIAVDLHSAIVRRTTTRGRVVLASALSSYSTSDRWVVGKR